MEIPAAPDKKSTMYPDQIPIGRFSAITRLSIKALRYYDERGLLVPKVKDPVTGFRYYTVDQISRGVNITTLLFLGFTIEEIRQLLDAMETGDSEKFGLIRSFRLDETTREIENLKRRTGLLGQCRPDALIPLSMTEPKIKTTFPVRVVSKSGRGPIQVVIHNLSRELLEAVQSPENQRNQVKITGPFMTIYPTGEHDISNILVERALPVSGRVVVFDREMEVKTLTESQVMSLVHKGPYESLHIAYAHLLAEMAKEGFEAVPPFIEIYLNNPVDTPPEEYMTEIQATIHLSEAVPRSNRMPR